MANFNKVLLIGNLTRDPELRSTQSGSQVAKLGLAVNRQRKDQQGNTQEETCFVDCTAFGRTAEVMAQYLSKGRPVFIEGRLSYSTWQGQDGQKRSKLEVIVENFQFLGQGQGAGGGGGRQGGGSFDSGGGAGGGGGGDFGESGGFGEGAESEIPF